MTQHTPTRPAAATDSAMTPNRFRINLGKEAVRLALAGNWSRAAQINRAILELHPDDCEAANRLAKALIELSDYAGARAVLDDLCRRSPNNSIARKNLSRLEKLESAGTVRLSAPVAPAGLSPLFIEDGGKSCTATLRQVANDSVLATLSAGDPVALVQVDDAVIVATNDDKRLGIVEPRLSRRLRKLIAGGNRYTAAVVAVSGGDVSVIIRESHQHPSLRNVISFPSGSCPPAPADEMESNAPAYEEPDPLDVLNEPDTEDAISVLMTDEVEDDPSGDADDTVPVLDTDDVADAPLPVFVPQEAEEWE